MSLGERYECLEVLARGNMGVLYRALDRRLGREVALKQILGGESEEERGRFLREAEAIARLSHPHIVAVHDYGESEGHPWMALEFLRGETLAQVVQRQGPLPPRRVCALGAALADALAHAHEAGILHRDLKPDNVMLVEGHPYLVDFGLARLLDRATRLTASQDLLGTPAYMAPEQAQGEHERVGPLSDLYGLAATLYFAASGQAPLVGATLIDTLQRIASEVPALAQSGQPELDAVLAQALAKDPRRRPASAAAFAARLRALAAAPVLPASRAPRRAPLLLLGLALVAGGLGSAAAVWVLRPGARPASPSPDQGASPARSPEGTGLSGGFASQASATPSASPAAPSPGPRLTPRPLVIPPLPEAPQAAAQEVRALAERLQLREALGLLERARERWPEDPELRIWTSGWLHAQLGSWSAARAAFEEGAGLDPERLARLCRLPGDRRLYPSGPDLRTLQEGTSNPLLFDTRWTPWLGGRWRFREERVEGSQLGFGSYNLAVALDEAAPEVPRELEVEVCLEPEPGGGDPFAFAGICFGAQASRDFFCLFLVLSANDPVYGPGDAATFRDQRGGWPVFA